MYARSTTFHGKPDGVEAGIKLVKSEVGPMIEDLEGSCGLSLLVDRMTGDCIVTSSWRDRATMIDSDDRLRPMRDRGRELIGNSVQVDEWEIVVMHRTHHGECARVTWAEGDVDAMAESFRTSVLPELERLVGFCGASLMVNERTGIACATTCWESPETMMASAVIARDLRQTVVLDAAGGILDIREFELAYAHLRVPEMA